MAGKYILNPVTLSLVARQDSGSGSSTRPLTKPRVGQADPGRAATEARGTQRQLQDIGRDARCGRVEPRIRQRNQHRGYRRTARSGATCHWNRLSNRQRSSCGNWPLWTGSLDDLESLKVPSGETIDRFEGRSPSPEECERIQDRNTDLSDDVSQLDQPIEQLPLQGDVPTEADLGAAREVAPNRVAVGTARLQQNDPLTAEASEFLRRFPRVPSCFGLRSECRTRRRVGGSACAAKQIGGHE